MRIWKSAAFWIVIAAAIAAGGAGWYFSAPAVTVGRPSTGPAVEAVYATGVVEPVTWAKVASLVRGRIVDHCGCEGATVARGDELARLDDVEQRAQVTELHAREAFLEKEIDRYGRLRKTDTVSAKEYDRIASDLDQVRAAIAAAKQRLLDYTIRAPIAGVLLRRDGEVGEIADAGQILFWVGRPRPLWITAEVDEEDIPLVKAGQATLIKADAFPGRALEGRVERITPKGDPVNKSYRVRIALPDDTPLLIGMTTEVNVVVREVRGALLVPIDAVAGGRVFTLEDGRARARDVTAGIKGQAMLQITGGLDASTPIVLDPPPGLRDGARVRPRPAPETPSNPGGKPRS